MALDTALIEKESILTNIVNRNAIKNSLKDDSYWQWELIKLHPPVQCV